MSEPGDRPVAAAQCEALVLGEARRGEASVRAPTEAIEAIEARLLMAVYYIWQSICMMG